MRADPGHFLQPRYQRHWDRSAPTSGSPSPCRADRWTVSRCAWGAPSCSPRTRAPKASYLLGKVPRARRPPARPPAGTTTASPALTAWGPRLRPRPAPPRLAQVIAVPRPKGPRWGRQTPGTGVAAPPGGVLVPLPGPGLLGDFSSGTPGRSGHQTTSSRSDYSKRKREEGGRTNTHEAGCEPRGFG